MTKRMGLFNNGYKVIIWTVLFLCLLELCQVEGLRFRTRTYTLTYYTYDSHAWSIGTVLGVLAAGVSFTSCLIICCAYCLECCGCTDDESTNKQVIQQGQPQTVSTISNSSITPSLSTNEPVVYYNQPTIPNQQQYKTEYSAPPSGHNEVTSTGSVNIGFKS